MKRIVIEIEDDFHKKIKLQAVAKDKTVKGYVLDLIKADLQKEKEQTQ